MLEDKVHNFNKSNVKNANNIIILAAAEDILIGSQEAKFINITSFTKIIDKDYYILSNIDNVEILGKDIK